MKTLIITLASITIMMAGGCQSTDLSQEIIGQWKTIYMEVEEMPIDNISTRVNFMSNGTWTSEIDLTTEADQAHGNYTVSGNILTIHSKPDEEGSMPHIYVYNNGLLKQTKPSFKDVLRKVK